MIDASQLLAVDEHVPRAGSIVWWRLSGNVPVERLAAAFAAADLPDDLLPGLCQPATALARAMHDQGSRRRLVRTLDGSSGRAIVAERAQGDALDYSVELRARVTGEGQLAFDPLDHPLVGPVRGRYEEHLGLVTADDAGSWLVRLIGRQGGVRLRDTGGVYFLPADSVAEWGRIAAAVHAATDHRINGVPAMRSEDAVASVLDALQVEAEGAAAELEAELDLHVESVGAGNVAGQLSARKATTRERWTTEVLAKVVRYEDLLGRRVEGLRERLERLRGGLAGVALARGADL